MSGIADDITLAINGWRLDGWLGAIVGRSLEGYPSSFSIMAAEMLPGAPDGMLARPGDRCEVWLGADKVVTGYVDRYIPTYRPGGHETQIMGRGLGQDLVDCSADFEELGPGFIGSQITTASLLDMATQLAKPFGITVKSNIGEIPIRSLGGPLRLNAALGETPYEIIERVARFAEVLIYEDEEGRLILDRVGQQKMASGFQQGVNIEAANITFSIDQRYSRYIVLWNSIAQWTMLPGGDLANQRAVVEDKTVPRHRPRIIISEQSMPERDYAKARAEWEKARRYGRSQAVSLTCDSWRDSAGKLWQINALAPMHIPELHLPHREWVIGSVTFRKDGAGTHADLVMMPQDAFLPQPNVLQLYDLQVARAFQDARPPSSGGLG